MKYASILCITGALVLSLSTTCVYAAEKVPSRYLECDGQPNNTTAGESAARLLGAVTLLGLFAPSPEFPDASKRKFGDDGVTICSSLIDGEKSEGNQVRRLELLMARAVHQIEAKHYDLAISDSKLARTEAAKLGLTNDPYFNRSMGLSIDLIESEALIRNGKNDEARSVGLQKIRSYPHSYYPLIASRSYPEFQKDVSDLELEQMSALEKISIAQLQRSANRLDEVRRFSEAAQKRELFIEFFELLNLEDRPSGIYASAAVTHALANNWAKADERAKIAKDNLQHLREVGRTEDEAALAIEILDLYDILKLNHDGNIKDARRNFAARSRWSFPSFGQIVETNRLLRSDAKDDEIFGSLKPTPNELWENRRDEKLATMLEKDKNNKTLFGLILPFAPAKSYESLSKNVWRTDKSHLMLEKQRDKSHEWVLFIESDPMTQVDALLLHAALQAKSRGQVSFNYSMLDNSPSLGAARFISASGDKISEGRALNVDAVIAELRTVIPDPVALKAIRAAQTK